MSTKRLKNKIRIRKKISGTAERPRIVVTTAHCRCAMFQVADINCFARDDHETYDLVMRWRTENALRERFSSISVLDCLTLRQRALFTSLFTPKEFKKGEVLWSPGDPVVYAYVFASGELRIERKTMTSSNLKSMRTKPSYKILKKN